MDMQLYSDRDLVMLALSDNQLAFSLLMQRHQGSLGSYIQHQFSVGGATEDLLLVIFDKAFRNLHKYNPQFAFSTWLYTIAENSCIDYVRKEKALALAFRRVSLKFGYPSSESIPSTTDPESEMIASQEAALLLHHINRLKPIYREPARLRFLQEYAYEEIAKELAIPLGTVRIRIHRAKEILAKWISPS